MSTGDTDTGKIQTDLWVSTTCRDRLDKLERLCWEMNKERGTDGLVWEQDMLNANRRIAELEGRMSGMCELQQICEGKIAALRETAYCLSNDSNATHEQHENRIAALETYRMDSNAVEARQDDDINRMKGRVGDTAERVKALEDRLQTVWIAPINELKERCFALESAVSSLKLCLPPPPEELYSIGTSRKLRRLPPWCGCPHATAVCAMVDAGKMWEPANCGICQWRIISWNPTEPKTPFVPRGNNPPQPPCPPEDQDPTVTPWQLYKVASDARTKLYLKLEDIEANIDKLSKPKGFDSGVA